MVGSSNEELGKIPSMMPALFVGHGSPMNIIANNPFTQSLQQLSRSLPKPRAILAISAHWETPQTEVLMLERPGTLYDFGGFPDELSRITYPAPGAPQLGLQLIHDFPQLRIKPSSEWGFDHGVWSVLHHLFPQADVPVLAMSLSKRLTMPEHLAIASKLKKLRHEGIMILGSGNITHNLSDLDWENPQASPFPWAEAFDQIIEQALLTGDDTTLIQFHDEALWKKAHPRREHYLPLLYAVGCREPEEKPNFFYKGFEHGSLSMRSFYYSGSGFNM